MKRYIKSSEDSWDMDYHPEISEDVDDIITTLQEEVKQKFQRRYKNIQVDVDDIKWSSNRLEADVDIYNGEKHMKSAHFSFSAYDSYFDHEDYVSHLNRKIYEFVSNMTAR